jgi:hypothetical protein
LENEKRVIREHLRRKAGRRGESLESTWPETRLKLAGDCVEKRLENPWSMDWGKTGAH